MVVIDLAGIQPVNIHLSLTGSVVTGKEIHVLLEFLARGFQSSHGIAQPTTLIFNINDSLEEGKCRIRVSPLLAGCPSGIAPACSTFVLRTAPLKFPTPTADRDRPVSRMQIHLFPDGMDYTTILI